MKKIRTTFSTAVVIGSLILFSTPVFSQYLEWYTLGEPYLTMPAPALFGVGGGISYRPAPGDMYAQRKEKTDGRPVLNYPLRSALRSSNFYYKKLKNKKKLTTTKKTKQ